MRNTQPRRLSPGSAAGTQGYPWGIHGYPQRAPRVPRTPTKGTPAAPPLTWDDTKWGARGARGALSPGSLLLDESEKEWDRPLKPTCGRIAGTPGHHGHPSPSLGPSGCSRRPSRRRGADCHATGLAAPLAPLAPLREAALTPRCGDSPRGLVVAAQGMNHPFRAASAQVSDASANAVLLPGVVLDD